MIFICTKIAKKICDCYFGFDFKVHFYYFLNKKDAMTD